jgi:diguanylate cyclase (GGDEF)-like protein
MLDFLKQIVRPERTERSQAAARIAVTGLALAYLGGYFVTHPAFTGFREGTLIALGYLLFSFVVYASLRIWEEPCLPRRGVVILTDLAAISVTAHLTGPSGAALYPLYLWVIVGNGMRFGLPYLLAAMVTGLVGFGIVIVTTEFWLRHAPSASGLFAGLIVLPLFYAGLLRQLQSANNRLLRQIDEATFSATHDALTGLPNRAQFKEHLNRAAKRATRAHTLLGLMYLDLDRFKVVNDSLGHEFGDRMLVAVANRLASCMRATDTVCRMSGDEFTIIMENLDSAQEAALLAERLMAQFAEPFNVSGREIVVSLSIGISIYPTDTSHVGRLMEDADAAMYRAKQLGRNDFVFYTRELNAQAMQRLELELDLRQALKNDEFVLYYQPRISTATGMVVGIEALLRWQHASRGLLEPCDFIPMLEDTGLVNSVGEWVIDQSCKQCKALQEEGHADLGISVNVSSRQFHSRTLVASVQRALANSGLPASDLELELTESILVEDTEQAVALLNDLKELGVVLSIDDFGTGYSSLSYLMYFPIDHLKIDRSFVRDITTNKEHAMLTSAITAMAKNLNLGVVAEGVETREQLQFLKTLGCHEMQGHLFGKPVSAEDLRRFLREWERLDSIGDAALAPDKG